MSILWEVKCFKVGLNLSVMVQCILFNHLGRAVFFNDACGPLAEQLSGIGSFVSRGNSLFFPKVQCTTSQVQRRDGRTADMSVVILTACQVA